MALNRDRAYATRHDPVEMTVDALVGPIVAYVRAHPGQTVPAVCAAFPMVPLRKMYSVLGAAARRKLLRKDRLNNGTRGFCVQPYHAPVPPRTAQGTKDGYTPTAWVHPIRARALGLTPPSATAPTHPLLDPDFSHPMKGAA